MNLRITRAQVEEFIADPARIGHRYLDHYAVWTTSGITDRQDIFVHDDGAQVMYTAMLIARTSRHMRSLLRDGRVESLFVAVDQQLWGRFDPATGRLQIHEQAEPGDEDLLDQAATQTLLHGGAVYVVEQAQMPAETPLAAVFRY